MLFPYRDMRKPRAAGGVLDLTGADFANNLYALNVLQNVGHEMKTSLAVINGYLELSLDSEKQKKIPDESIITNMTRALTEGNLAVFMAKQIFDAVLFEDGRMMYTFERINVKRLIIEVRDDYFAMLNKNHNTLTLSLPDDLPDVYADVEHVLHKKLKDADKMIIETDGKLKYIFKPEKLMRDC